MRTSGQECLPNEEQIQTTRGTQKGTVDGGDHEAPKQVVEQKYMGGICQSTTLKGKKCTFKATCGKFCKKHSVANKDLVAFLAK